jgi:Amt family ammonium transporter
LQGGQPPGNTAQVDIFEARFMTSCLLLRCTRHSVAIATASLLPLSAWSQAVTPPVVEAAKRFDGGNAARMLVATVLVLIMTTPGLMHFFSGMLRTKNALSVVAHIFVSAAVVTLVWAMVGYSIAFTPGNG